AVAVNPVTNKVYVANYVSGNVTVIDGATSSVATVTVGACPRAVAVNPVTNKVYVANELGKNVTVIDGATNTATTVCAGNQPYAVAVNPVTNKVYVANYYGAVTVIDGTTNATTTVVAGGEQPFDVAVNPVTNKVYVANYNSDNVTVIDGATNSATTVGAGAHPWAVAVNSVTNNVYVANYESGNVTVIDGATNSTATVGAGDHPYALAVNPVTNRVYVANFFGNNVTVIDGDTNTTTTVGVGDYPNAVAVNPVTNKVYVANYRSDNVTVIDEQLEQPIPLTVSITPLPQNRTLSPTPVFTFDATSTFSPIAPPPTGVYYQADTMTGPWLGAAPGAGDTYTGATPALSPGVHILYAFAADSQMGDSVNTGAQSSPLIGTVAAYVFLVGDTHTITVTQGAHGTITPAGSQAVEYGSDKTFAITADAGYHLADVLKDGASIGASSSVTFANVTSNHTLSAVFAVNSVTRPTWTRLSGPSSVRVKKTLKLTGTVSPSSATGRVTIVKTRLVGKKWKSAGSVKVYVKNGKFSYSFKPTKKGKWRFVAKYSGGVVGVTTYGSSKSAVKNVRVK
ncbi:MAG: YncE family protein, partial [Moraxellaceae bacterium]|nr:YncE family protein [Moraxellaceae bacterium]